MSEIRTGHTPSLLYRALCDIATNSQLAKDDF